MITQAPVFEFLPKETAAQAKKFNKGLAAVALMVKQADESDAAGIAAPDGATAANYATLSRALRWDALRAEAALLPTWPTLRESLSRGISDELARLGEALESARAKRIASLEAAGIAVAKGSLSSLAHSTEEKRLDGEFRSVKELRYGIAPVADVVIRLDDIQTELAELYKKM